MAPESRNPNANPKPVRAALLGDLPPAPVKTTRGKMIMLIASGVIFAALLLVVVLNIEKPPAAPPNPAHTKATELINPEGLTPEDLSSPGLDVRRDTAINTPRGGWIEVLDEGGRPKQSYRYDRSDALPAGMLKVENPEVKIYLSDDRLMHLVGDTALIKAPQQALEAGTITGNVVIRLYELPAQGLIDLETATPIVLITTHEAQYDNFQGEVRCDGHIDLQTKSAHQSGGGLRLQINDQLKRPEWLRVEKIDYVKLAWLPEESPGQEQTAGPQAASPQTRPARNQARHGEVNRSAMVDSSRRESPAVRDESDRSAARARPRSAQSPATAPATQQFYRLNFHENVRIVQGDDATGWVANGIDLDVIFSTNSRGLGQNLATNSAAQRPELPLPSRERVGVRVQRTSFRGGGLEQGFEDSCFKLLLLHRFTSLTLTPALSLEGRGSPGRFASAIWLQVSQEAQSATQPGIPSLYTSTGQEITITCTGPMTMTPLEPARWQPTSPEDSALELHGEPAVMISHADQARVQCTTMRYESLSQRLELTGSDLAALRMDTPDFHAGGDWFQFDRLTNHGKFRGEGWMESIGETQSAAGPPTAQESALSANPPLRIVWNEGVDLQFQKSVALSSAATQPATRPSRLRASEDQLQIQHAQFSGDIQVTSDDFIMNCGRMEVNFGGGEIAWPVQESGPGGASTPKETRPSIDLIHATQDVRIQSVRDAGTLAAADLEITLRENAQGRIVPVQLAANGEVEAADENQTVWADLLHATFAEISTDQGQMSDGSIDRRLARSGVQVVHVLAERNVQVRMSDGTRAFAEQLDGDPLKGVVVLTSPNEVLIAGQTMIIDQGKRLELHRDDQTARWPGAGRARVYRDNVLADSTTRIDLPVIDEKTNPLQVRALWSNSMAFDNQANAGGGSLTLTGNVDAIAQPSALEYNTMTGQSLRLEFARLESDGAAGSAANEQEAAQSAGEFSANPLAPGKRQLSRLLAEGGARLESRSWLSDDRSDVPRVFYVAGQSVWYNNLTLEAGVPGAGELMIRDERPLPADAPTANTAIAPFSARGTSHFQWKDSLQMSRIADHRYQIVMTGATQGVHKDLGNQNTIISGKTLSATVERTHTDRPRSAAVDLGGAMELRRLAGDGGVYIRTVQRDVSCDDFDYDLGAQMARLNAVDGRVVTVFTRGNPNVIRAQYMSWDMARDIVIITSGRGTANP